MNKLIKMTDFVFYIDNNREFARNYDKILAYAKFLKQPLELWMFTNKKKSLFIYDPFFESFTQLDMDNQTIEDLLSDDFDYFLNETAQKQLGL